MSKIIIHQTSIEADFGEHPRRIGVCTCGWEGPPRKTLVEAASDITQHATEVEAADE